MSNRFTSRERNLSSDSIESEGIGVRAKDRFSEFLFDLSCLLVGNPICSANDDDEFLVYDLEHGY